MERDIFLWLKRPVIAEMRAVLEWAHERALRKDIRCDGPDWRKKYPSDRSFEDILSHINQKAKGFFRIIVRKGWLGFMVNKEDCDILDIGIHCVRIRDKEYYLNLYLDAALLKALKRRFALTE